MNTDTVITRAHLVEGVHQIPVDVMYMSKYSVLVRFLNGNGYGNGSEFSKMVIRMNGEKAELGRCRIESEPHIDGFSNRLHFLEDVYDFESLFFKNQVINLQSSFMNLPMVLAHKKDITPAFRNFTSDLNYDLSVYRNIFDRIDDEYHGEPEKIRQLVQKTIIETEGQKFMHYLDERLMELNGLVKDFSKEEHEYHGFYFRKQLWEKILCAPFMVRTNLKPRGYAGDSEMMTMIYANDFRGDSTFGKLLHKHPIKHPAAQAVRNRRTLVAEMLPKVWKRYSAGGRERMRVLSVACGPAYEMQDVIFSEEEADKYHFTLLDQDRSALHEAATKVTHIEETVGCKVKVDYLNESVRTLIKTPKLQKVWGQFDFIYSMGLFDYLTPPVAKAVLGKLCQLLSPNGELVVGNYHVSNPGRYYMEYWLDWVLYYRTECDFVALLEDIPSVKSEVVFEDTCIQMFLHVKNKMAS